MSMSEKKDKTTQSHAKICLMIVVTFWGHSHASILMEGKSFTNFTVPANSMERYGFGFQSIKFCALIASLL